MLGDYYKNKISYNELYHSEIGFLHYLWYTAMQEIKYNKEAALNKDKNMLPPGVKNIAAPTDDEYKIPKGIELIGL